MKLSRLTTGEALAALAAILLFAFLFFDWYGAEVSGQVRAISLGGGAGEGGNAWQTLDVIPLVLALSAAFAVGAVALRAFGSGWQPAVPLCGAIAVLGGLSTLLVLFRILVPPDFGALGGVPVNATLELGPFLGLAASAVLAYGGFRAMGERGTSFEKISADLARDFARDPLGKGDDRHHRVDAD